MPQWYDSRLFLILSLALVVVLGGCGQTGSNNPEYHLRATVVQQPPPEAPLLTNATKAFDDDTSIEQAIDQAKKDGHTTIPITKSEYERLTTRFRQLPHITVEYGIRTESPDFKTIKKDTTQGGEHVVFVQQKNETVALWLEKVVPA